MAIRFIAVGEQAFEALVKSLEEACGLQLPAPFRTFLVSEANGADLEPNFHPGMTRLGIERFLSVSEIADAMELYGVRLAAGMVPVAEAAGGNLVLLDADDGSVHFFDHEMERERKPHAALETITSSFDALLDELQPDERDIREELGLPPGASLGHVVQTADDPEFERELREQGLT